MFGHYRLIIIAWKSIIVRYKFVLKYKRNSKLYRKSTIHITSLQNDFLFFHHRIKYATAACLCFKILTSSY